MHRLPALARPRYERGLWTARPTDCPNRAVAVFECLQVMGEAIWQRYGPQVQQAWRDQLRAGPMPDFDPDELS